MEVVARRGTYRHSAYWYAYHCGWTHSEAETYTGKYLDMHMYRPKMKERPGGEWRGRDWFAWRNAEKRLDSTFDPLMLGVCIAMDIGIAMRDTVRTIADPAERDRMKRELMRDLRIVRRPFYYAREKERRRMLAAERRKKAIGIEREDICDVGLHRRRKDTGARDLHLGNRHQLDFPAGEAGNRRTDQPYCDNRYLKAAVHGTTSLLELYVDFLACVRDTP